MTNISYGDVLLSNVQTRGVHHEVVYDDTRTRFLYHKFRLTIEALCHQQSMRGHTQNIVNGGQFTTDAPGNLTGAGGQYAGLRYFLMQPRQPFVMSLDGRVLLHAASVATVATNFKLKLAPNDDDDQLVLYNADVNNGPIPIDCQLKNFAGRAVLKVQWTVEICIRDCPGGLPDPQVLANTWSLTDKIDNHRITTRTMQGILHLIPGTINPHSLRGLVVPGLAKGFRREDMTFEATPDNAKLKYTVVDKEMCFAPPGEGVSWSLKHSEDFTPVKVTATCHVVLVGDRLSNKDEMRFNAARIAYWRVLGDAHANNNRMTHVVVTDTCSEIENRVEFLLQAERRGEEDEPFKQGARRATMVLDSSATYPGKPVVMNYDKEVIGNPGTAGTASIFGAFVAVLQSACDPSHSFIDTAAPAVPSTADQTSLPTIKAYQVDKIDENLNPEYSASHEGHLYVSYRSESRYDTTRNRASADLATTQDPPSTSPGEEPPPDSTPTYPYDSTVVFDLAKPSRRRTLMIEAERVGDWPEFPEPQDFTDENGVKNSVMNDTVQLGTAEVLPDESLLYRATMNVTLQLGRATVKATDAVSEAAAALGAGFVPWLKPESKLQTKPMKVVRFGLNSTLVPVDVNLPGGVEVQESD